MVVLEHIFGERARDIPGISFIDIDSFESDNSIIESYTRTHRNCAGTANLLVEKDVALE